MCPGSASLDLGVGPSARCHSVVNPALLTQILQNALAQLGLPAVPGADALPDVLAGLSPAQLTQLGSLLSGGTPEVPGLTPQQLQILFPNGVPDVNALTSGAGARPPVGGCSPARGRPAPAGPRRAEGGGN